MEYGEFQQADLHEVTRLFISTETTVAHAINATVLNVYDSGDFRDEGGFLKVFIDAPDPEADPETPEAEEVSYVLEYETKDDDLNTITLIDPLPVAIEEDTRVWPDPLASEKWGSVVIDGDSEPVPALVHSNLELGVEEGIRDEPEGVIVQLQGNDYVIVAFPGKGTTIDWEGIDPDTIPDPTQGPGPGEAPVLNATPGLRSVHLDWTMIAPNPYTKQTVYYEIHASTVEDFTPGEGTFLAAQLGHVLLVQEMPNGAELSTTDPTYFQVRAFDKNGAGPWSNEVSAIAIAGLDPAIVEQLQEDLGIARGELDTLNNTTIPNLNIELGQLEGKFPVTSVDIGPDAVTAPKILAGAVLTEKITVNTLNGDRIAVNTLQAGKIVAGSITTDRFTSNTINGDVIAGNTLNAVKIVAGSIISDNINTGAITSTKLATGAVIADKIDTGAITADKIDVNALNGKIITGSTIQTASSGSRIVLAPSGVGTLLIYNSANSQIAYIGQEPFSGKLAISAPSVGLSISGTIDCQAINANGNVTATRLVTGVGTADAAANTYMDSAGMLLKTASSAAKYKTNIRDHGLDPEELWAWEPVLFDYRDDSPWPGIHDRLGIIADHAVGTPFENFVSFDNGEVENYDYARHAAVVHTILLKELRAELAELRALVLENAS